MYPLATAAVVRRAPVRRRNIQGLGEAKPAWFDAARAFLTSLSRNDWYGYQVRDRGWKPFTNNEFVAGVWQIPLPNGPTIWAWRKEYQQGPLGVTKVTAGLRDDAYDLNLPYAWQAGTVSQRVPFDPAHPERPRDPSDTRYQLLTTTTGDYNLNTASTAAHPLSQPPADFISLNPPPNAGTQNIDTGFNYRREGLGPTIALLAPLAVAAGAAIAGGGVAAGGGAGGAGAIAPGAEAAASGATGGILSSGAGAGAIAPGAEAVASGATGGILSSGAGAGVGAGAGGAGLVGGGSLLSTGVGAVKTAAQLLSTASTIKSAYQQFQNQQATTAAATGGAAPALIPTTATANAVGPAQRYSAIGGMSPTLLVLGILGVGLVFALTEKKRSHK